jgi:hypothetical protein
MNNYAENKERTHVRVEMEGGPRIRTIGCKTKEKEMS